MQAHVCAAKAGVDMLTRCLCLEWAATACRVNAVIPGPIADTEGMARLSPTQEARDAVTAIGAARPRRHERTRSPIWSMFLASPLAAYVSGAVIPVDGGWTAAGARGFRLSELTRR